MTPEVSGRRLRRGLRSAAVFLAVLLCFALAKAQESKDAVKTYVGPLTGAPASARLAVVADGGRVMAYVCSGDPAFNETYSRWLKGTLAETGAVSAESADGLKITGRLADGLLEVKLTHPTEKALVFQTKELAPRGIAGLYRAEHKTAETATVFGWIIDRDHGVVGTAGKGKTGGKVQTLQPPKGNQPLVTTSTIRKKLPPPGTGPISDKHLAELENKAAEVVREEQGGRIVAQGTRVTSVPKLTPGGQK